MKKAGIVGGIGPASTLDYYSGIISGARAKTDDGNYPEFVINSINMTEMLSFVAAKDWDGLVRMLLGAIQNLVGAGAELAAIASNTPHIVFSRLQERSPLPLVSIVDATCQTALSKGCRKAVVIGTYFTMSNGLYSEAFRKYGIDAVVPSENERQAIHGFIFPKLEEGIVDTTDKRKMLTLVNGLLTEHHADALVLGCTELPLMIRDGDLDMLILNTTQIHIDAIVDAILAE